MWPQGGSYADECQEAGHSCSAVFRRMGADLTRTKPRARVELGEKALYNKSWGPTVYEVEPEPVKDAMRMLSIIRLAA